MKESVVPGFSWNDSEDFHNNWIGFSLIWKDEIVSTAFSAFIQENKLELGIETLEGHEGKGDASLVCSSLIDY